MRKIKFQTGEYYHIFNRGVDKRDVFMDERDYIRFIWNMREFNNNSYKEERDYILRKAKEKHDLSLNFNHRTLLGSGYPEPSSVLRLITEYIKHLNELLKLVDIISYCVNPNHYHFLLEELTGDGIATFLHKLDLGYTQYFNRKYKRSGTLLEGTYKAIHIKTDEYLLYLSSYINGNPEIHKIARAEVWPWSSYRDYLNIRQGTLVNKNVMMKDFGDAQEYRDYTNLVIRGAGERKDDLKRYFLE